jgi:hypothetical protein
MQNLDEWQYNQNVEYFNEYLFDTTVKAPTGSFITESGYAMPATELGRFLLKVRDVYVQGAKNFKKESKGIEKKIREFYDKNIKSKEERSKAHASNVKWYFHKIITPYFSKMSVCIDKTGTAIGNALIEYAKYFEKLTNTKIIPGGVTPDSVANTIPNRKRTADINDLGRGEGVIELGTSKGRGPKVSNKRGADIKGGYDIHGGRLKKYRPEDVDIDTNKVEASKQAEPEVDPLVEKWKKQDARRKVREREFAKLSHGKEKSKKSFVQKVKEKVLQHSYYDEFDESDEPILESYMI